MELSDELKTFITCMYFEYKQIFRYQLFGEQMQKNEQLIQYLLQIVEGNEENIINWQVLLVPSLYNYETITRTSMYGNPINYEQNCIAYMQKNKQIIDWNKFVNSGEKIKLQYLSHFRIKQPELMIMMEQIAENQQTKQTEKTKNDETLKNINDKLNEVLQQWNHLIVVEHKMIQEKVAQLEKEIVALKGGSQCVDLINF